MTARGPSRRRSWCFLVLAGVLSGIPLGASAAAVDPPPPASGLLLPSPPVEPPPVAPPPRPPLPSPPPPTALSTLSRRAVLALIIVPELCAAGVVGCLIYRYCKARRRAREGKDVGGDDENMVVYDYEAEAGGSAFEGGSVKSSQVMPLPRGGSNSFRTQTALIPASSVVIKEQIGFGASAKVFRALWSGTTVAVKVWNETDTSIQRKVSGSMDLSFGKPLLLHVTASGLSVGSGEFTQLAQFRSEVQLLSNLRHPNILQFFGLVPPLTLVMEFGARGSLRTALDAAAAAGEKARPLSWETRMGIAAGVAAGMAFLHEQTPSIVHRDLKPGNVILDSNFVPKVADFGLSIQETRLAGATNVAVGTLRYMAPEIMMLDSGPVRLPTAIDVYAYGWLLCDLKGRSPRQRNLRTSQAARDSKFEDDTSGAATQQPATTVGINSAFERTMPDYDMEGELVGLPEALAQVVRACCSRLPEDRPPFTRLREQMQELAVAEAARWDAEAAAEKAAARIAEAVHEGDEESSDAEMTTYPRRVNYPEAVHPISGGKESGPHRHDR